MDSGVEIIVIDDIVTLVVETDFGDVSELLEHVSFFVGDWGAADYDCAWSVQVDGGRWQHAFEAWGDEIGVGRHDVEIDGDQSVTVNPAPNANDPDFEPWQVIVADCDVTQAPAYAIVGIPADLDGHPFRLVAEGDPEGGQFRWHARWADGQEGAADFQPVSTDASKVNFVARRAGHVTVSAEYYDVGVPLHQQGKTFPVYDLIFDLKREPAHDWVEVGECVTYTAVVKGRLEKQDGSSDEIDLPGGLVEWQVYHYVDGEKRPLEGSEFHGQGRTFRVQLSEETYVIEAVLYRFLPSSQPESDSEEGEGPSGGFAAQSQTPRADGKADERKREKHDTAVRLYVEGHDEKTVLAVGEEHTLKARIANPGSGVQFKFKWRCPEAEFKQGDDWVSGELDVTTDRPECTVALRFTEPKDNIEVKLSVDVLKPAADPQQQAEVIKTLQAPKRYKDQNSSDLADDFPMFLAIRLQVSVPSGDPAKEGEAQPNVNEFCFDASEPGKLRIECQARILPDSPDAKSYIENRIRWWLRWHAPGTQEIPDWSFYCSPRWRVDWDGDGVVDDPAEGEEDDTAMGLSPVVEYTGLPAFNSSFGPKSYCVAAFGDKEESLSGFRALCSVRGRVELFYEPEAKNHPGEGHGVTPNWFYYWQQTGAGDPKAKFAPWLSTYGETNYMTEFYALWGGKYIIKAPGLGYLPGMALEDAFYIGPSAYLPRGGRGLVVGGGLPNPNGGEIGPTVYGIDAFMIICRHERDHYDRYRSGFMRKDSDGDGVADFLEDLDGDGKYDPRYDASDLNNANTFSEDFDDDEWRAYRSEFLYVRMLGRCDNLDWSKGGAQWGR